MSRALRIVLGLAALLGALALSVVALSEAGEVVVLHTTDDAGADHATRLWVVDLDGGPWLRAGKASHGWYARVSARPEIALERAGAVARWRVVPVPEASARVDAAMAEKYGLADRVIGLMRGSDSVALRLEPFEPNPVVEPAPVVEDTPAPPEDAPPPPAP